MLSSLQPRDIPQVWHIAVLGVLAALPAGVVFNWLPHFEVDATGSIIVIGAVIAGSIAVIRSIDPGAAGIRTGLLGGILEILVFSFGDTLAYIMGSAGTFIVVIFASGVLLVGLAAFGWVFGRLGGWVTNVVTTRYLRTTTNTE